MSQTKDAFAGRTKRSLKKILYRYMEAYGYKYFHKLTQFVLTPTCRSNCFIDLIPKIVKHSDFLSIQYSKMLWDFRKPKFKIGDSVGIWKYDLPCRKGYKFQFTQKHFEFDWVSSRKSPTYTKKDEQVDVSLREFYEKSSSKSFNNGISYKRFSFTSICANFSKQYTQFICKAFTGAPETVGSMADWNCCRSKYQNFTEGRFMFSVKKLEKRQFFSPKIGMYFSISDLVETMNTLIQNKHGGCITAEVSRKTQKIETYLAIGRIGLALSIPNLGGILGRNVGKEFRVMLRGKGAYKPEWVFDIVRIHSLRVYTELIEYKIVGHKKVPLLRCFLFISKLTAGDI